MCCFDMHISWLDCMRLIGSQWEVDILNSKIRESTAMFLSLKRTKKDDYTPLTTTLHQPSNVTPCKMFSNLWFEMFEVNKVKVVWNV